MIMLSFIFVVVCGRFEWQRICSGFFIVCLAMHRRCQYNTSGAETAHPSGKPEFIPGC
jgi:hypothetical protein